MPRTEASEIKKKAETLFKSINTLSARIRKRERYLCQYDGAKLENKKREIQKLQKLKTEKSKKLTKLQDRIPSIWNA